MKTKIISRSRVDDINTLSKSITNVFSDYDFSTDVYFSTQIAELKVDAELMTAAINKVMGNNILAPMDQKRDESFRVLFYEAKSKAHWPDKSISEAATIVREQLDVYGIETTRLANNTESSKINAMLQDLSEPKMVSAIKKLSGFQTLVTNLANDQKAFEVAYQESISQKVDSGESLSAGQIGEKIVERINDKIGIYLEAMAQSQPEVYQACRDKIATIIKESNGKVKARMKRNSHSEELVESLK